MDPRYEFVAFRGRHRCEYCRAPEVVFNFPFEVEHIIPLHLSGDDAEHNWALACRSCNVNKGVHLTGIDPIARTVMRLFHPRQDRWDEHFDVKLDAGRIEGLTSIGRATVERLGMNSPAQVAARRLWARLGLFS